MPEGAAERAGLQEGDVVLQLGDTVVRDGPQLRELIRASGQAGAPAASAWHIERAGRQLVLSVQPDLAEDQGQSIGRLGAMVGSAPEMVLVRQGPWQGLASGAKRVWDISVLSLRLQASLPEADNKGIFPRRSPSPRVHPSRRRSSR